MTYPPALAAALERLAAGTLRDVDRVDEVVIAAAFKLLSTANPKAEPLIALLAACDPDSVARTGFANYSSYQAPHARSALSRALEEVRDVPALADLFLTAWSKPKGTYFYGDMPIHGSFAAAIAAVPAVRDRLVADFIALEAGQAVREIEYRRTEAAASLLGRSKDRSALRVLADRVRRHRGTKLDGELLTRMYLPALDSLALAEDPVWVPTVMLALDGSPVVGGHERSALEHTLVANPEVAASLVRWLLRSELAAGACLDAVHRAGPAAASLADAVEPYLEHPHPRRRTRARAALAAIQGVTDRSIDRDDFRDVEAHLLHRDHEVRRDALEQVYARKDPSLVLALCIAEWVHFLVMAQVLDYPTHAFAWVEWDGIIPTSVIEMGIGKRLAWARANAATVLGEQRIPDVIAAVDGKEIREIQLGYLPFRIKYGDSKRAQLLALEEQAFAATA